MRQTGTADYCHEITELGLYLENDYGVARAYYFPTLRTIAKHYDKGRGDYEKGITALSRYAVLPAARDYVLRHCGMADSVRELFPKPIRDAVAVQCMDRFLVELRAGNRFWA